MKRTYKAPILETKEYAQLENVFTYCDKLPGTSSGCYNKSIEPDNNISDGKDRRCDIGNIGKGLDTCITYFDDSISDL